MEYGNTAIIFMVVAVVSCVLALSFFGIYYLNKVVDQNAPEGGSVRKT
jgi:flagellar biogenesis protein FliO